MNSPSLITKACHISMLYGAPRFGKCLPDSPDLSIGPCYMRHATVSSSVIINSESSIPAARIKVIGVITEARGERSTVTSAQGKISTVPL